MTFIITDETRAERRKFLSQYFKDIPNEALKDYSKEFKDLPFTLLDLYEIHLCDQIKKLISIGGYSLAEIQMDSALLKAQALATAKLVMIGYVAKT